jgi:hypothetical protein
MMEITDNTMEITAEDGTKETVRILFYYNNPERKKDFYFFYKEAKPDELIVMSSTDGKQLEEVTDEELEEAQEMLNTFETDPKIQRIK